MVHRHPFPGPGLGVRIPRRGAPGNSAELLRRADAIYVEELRKHDLYDRISQAFAVFLPVRSVGVMGDGRRYDYVIALRAVETVDFMTAHWARLPYEFSRPRLAAHRQRGSRDLPRGVRHLEQATGDDRVGVTSTPVRPQAGSATEPDRGSVVLRYRWHAEALQRRGVARIRSSAARAGSRGGHR